jgi:hypothetical protein
MLKRGLDFEQACHDLAPVTQAGESSDSLPDNKVSFDSIVTGRGGEVVKL